MGWDTNVYDAYGVDFSKQLGGIDLDFIPIPSVERRSRNENPKTIILHRFGSPASASNLIKYWQGKTRVAGTNFVVGIDGKIYQTASLNKTTSHLYPTKKQMMPGHFGIFDNDNTIGIEVEGNYVDGKWEALTYKQVQAVHNLINRLSDRYNLSNNNFFAHETVQRKSAGEGGTVINALNTYRAMLEPNF